MRRDGNTPTIEKKRKVTDSLTISRNVREIPKIITTGGRNDEIDQTFATKIANFTKKTKEFPNVLIVF